MNVRELITALSTHDPEASVLLEGCDCIGEAGQVHAGNGAVLVGKPDEREAFDAAGMYWEDPGYELTMRHTFVAQGWINDGRKVDDP